MSLDSTGHAGGESASRSFRIQEQFLVQFYAFLLLGCKDFVFYDVNMLVRFSRRQNTLERTPFIVFQ